MQTNIAISPDIDLRFQQRFRVKASFEHKSTLVWANAAVNARV